MDNNIIIKAANRVAALDQRVRNVQRTYTRREAAYFTVGARLEEAKHELDTAINELKALR